MFQRIVAPYRRFPLYLAPGNHDIWSRASEQVFRKFSGRDPHFSFDHGPVHVTVLDNSRTEGLAAAELRFLENDLKAQRGRPVKLIVSHRPSWLLEAAFRNPDFALHRLAKQYGVSHVIAGHVHQMLRFELEGIEYLSMPSAGGHLRASHKYKDGWFFGYSLVEVRQGKAVFQIHELKPPHGEGRVTRTDEWGAAGLK
jgi:3',5'-cyclic AMP phosphodiesterase CpdA